MEENNLQSTTMNLNSSVGVPYTPENPNNIGVVTNNVIPPVSDMSSIANPSITVTPTNVTTEIPAQVIQSQTIQSQTIIASSTPVQETITQEASVQETENPQTHAIVEEEQILKPSPDLKVRISSIRAIMANTEKAIVANQRIALSMVTQLKFTKEGLYVIASDNNVFISQLDNHYSYDQEASMGVDTLLFKALVDKLNVEEFTMELNTTNRTIKLKVGDTSEYVLQEQYARETGEAIRIELPQDMLSLPLKPLNNIVDIQTILKSMSVFACENDAHKEAYGVYIEPESISANDTDNMCIRNNDIEAFQGITLFPSLPLVKILKDVDLGNEGQIGFKIDEGRTTISRLIITTNKVTLIAPVNEEENYADYQIEGLKSFSNSNYNNIFKIEKSLLLQALDRLSLFVEENDSNAVTFNFKPGFLELESTKNNGKERIRIPECTSTLVTKKIDVRKLLNVLKYLSDKDIQIKIDDAIANMISLKTEDLTITMSVVD